MADPIWYLGPPGDLRPIVCPEKDIVLSLVRAGGTFQGLSGAQTLDITGYRQQMEFKFRYLEPDEYAWLKALHVRHIPGPFRVINPMEKNRLTPEASGAQWNGGTSHGLGLTSGALTRTWDWPSGAGTMGGVTSKWTGRLTGAVFRTDQTMRVTVIPGETITASVWMKASAPVSYNLVVDWWNRTALQSSTSISVVSVTTSWQRFSITSVVPAGAVTSQLAGWSSNTTADVYLGPMQFEAASSATSWELGGGSPLVSVEKLETTSPRYPYRDCTLTLLEV